MPNGGFSFAAAHTEGFAPARFPGLAQWLQVIAIQPRGGEAAAGVRMGMNYGYAGLLGEQRAPAAETMAFAP